MAESISAAQSPASSIGFGDAAVAPFVRAYYEYVKAYQTACVSPDLQQRLEEVRQHFLQAGADPQKQFEAYRSYAQTLQEFCAPDKVRNRLAEAFRRYVESVKAACSRIDPESLTPADLATVASALYAVAVCSAATWTGKNR